MERKSVLNLYRDGKYIVVKFSDKDSKESTGFNYPCIFPSRTILLTYDVNFSSKCEPTYSGFSDGSIISKFPAEDKNIQTLFDSLKKIVPSIKNEDLESLLKC